MEAWAGAGLERLGLRVKSPLFWTLFSVCLHWVFVTQVCQSKAETFFFHFWSQNVQPIKQFLSYRQKRSAMTMYLILVTTMLICCWAEHTNRRGRISLKVRLEPLSHCVKSAGLGTRMLLKPGGVRQSQFGPGKVAPGLYLGMASGPWT